MTSTRGTTIARQRFRNLCMIMLTLVILTCTSGVQASTSMNSPPSNGFLTEWIIPTRGSGPLGLSLDPSGRCCWFLEYFGNKLVHLDPANNTIQEWPFPTSEANPYSLATTASSGSLTAWGTEYGKDKVFAFSPDTAMFHEYSLSKYNSGGLGIAYISIEPASAQTRVWFTESLNNANGEVILDQKTHNVTLYEDAFPSLVGGGAYGLYAGQNVVWYAGFSSLVKWDRTTQHYAIWPLPVHGLATGRSITIDEYGQPWYTQGTSDGKSNDNFVGVLRGNNTLQEWRIPTMGSDPRGINVNPATQRPWVAMQSSIAGNGSIAVLDTSNDWSLASAQSTTIPSGGARTILSPISHTATATSIVVTPTTTSILGSQSGQFTQYSFGATLPRDSLIDSSGTVWFTEPAANKIARLTLTTPDFALLVAPPTMSLPRGGSGSVTISGSSIYGYSGQVTLQATSVPRDVTLSSFTQNPFTFTPGIKLSSKLTINVGPNASTGTNMLSIQGTDGNVTHGMSLMLTITNSTAPAAASKCFIATAAYGSDVSPEVQILRNFRDNSLTKTKIGSSFLIVFNAWYYSFSPYVAEFLNQHSIVRSLVKDALYPLIAFFFISSELYGRLSVSPELATILSGLLAIALIGAFYIGLPIGLLISPRRRPRRNLTRIPAILFLAGMIAILIGQTFDSTVLLMFSTSITALSALLASAWFTAMTVSRNNLRKKGSRLA